MVELQIPPSLQLSQYAERRTIPEGYFQRLAEFSDSIQRQGLFVIQHLIDGSPVAITLLLANRYLRPIFCYPLVHIITRNHSAASL